NVNPYFDNRCSHHYVGFSFGKSLHFVIFVFVLHFSVNDAYAVFWQREISRKGLITILKVFIIHFFGLLNKREHHIHLTAFFDFVFHELPDLESGIVETMSSNDRLSSFGKFINNRKDRKSTRLNSSL